MNKNLKSLKGERSRAFEGTRVPIGEAMSRNNGAGASNSGFMGLVQLRARMVLGVVTTAMAIGGGCGGWTRGRSDSPIGGNWVRRRM